MIVIDYGDKRPIYEQIVEKFRMLILNGVLTADEKMPSVRNLAIDLSINPNTIQRAYTELERMGFVYSINGKGSFVSSNRDALEVEKEKMIDAMKALMKKCREAGIAYKEVQLCLNDVYKEVADI